jgi:hypothetical protein
LLIIVAENPAAGPLLIIIARTGHAVHTQASVSMASKYRDVMGLLSDTVNSNGSM